MKDHHTWGTLSVSTGDGRKQISRFKVLSHWTFADVLEELLLKLYLRDPAAADEVVHRARTQALKAKR